MMMACLLWLFSTTACMAQDWLPLLEQIAEEEESTEACEQAYDLLSELEQHPMDINTATREQWMQMPFLNDSEIDAIREYIDRHGPMKSMGELAMIAQLDYTKRQLLAHFVSISNTQEAPQTPSLAHILKYGKHELLASARIPFYERKGDQNGYLGYPYRHDVRYSFQYKQRVMAGFVGAQDAGEPFFSGRNKTGYDFYSLYVVMRDIGPLKALALGRYRVNFGMGLVVNNNFLLGKSWAVDAISANRNNIRQHSSRSSSNFMQGAAATVQLHRRLSMSGFISYRDIDATLNKDGSMASISTSGYHRTPTEMDKKNISSQFVAGMNLQFAHVHYYIGATAAFTFYHRPLHPNREVLYRRYAAYGKEFWNVGVNYGLLLGPLTLHGETATGNSRAIATINRLSWRATDNLSVMVLQRYYGMKFTSPLGKSVSDGTGIQNESALYLGLNWHPSRRFVAEGYADIAYHPWARYQVSRSSHSYDFTAKMSYALHRNWQVVARYRLRRRQQDNEDKSALLWKTDQRARLTLNYQTEQLNLRTQADFSHCSFKTRSKGWMLSEQATWQLQKATRLTASAAWFHTDDYNSRVYGYERSLLYDFSIPAYYGQGIRYMLMARHSFSQKLMLTAKVGVTNYFDRSTIGTGLQQVDRSSMTDLLLQLRIKL